MRMLSWGLVLRGVDVRQSGCVSMARKERRLEFEVGFIPGKARNGLYGKCLLVLQHMLFSSFALLCFYLHFYVFL